LKLRTVALIVVVAALVTAGTTLGVTKASAQGPNVTYYACLAKGKLTNVGTTAPTCKSSATQISWNSQGATGTDGTNGTSFVTSPTMPAGACSNGDTDLELDNDDLWTCVGGSWSNTGTSVQGAQGAQGPAGPGQVIDLHDTIATGSRSDLDGTIGTSLGAELYCSFFGTPDQLTLANDGSGEATLNWNYSDGSTVSANGAAEGSGLNFPSFVFTGGHLDGEWVYDDGNSVVTLNLVLYNGGGSSCQLSGTALIAPASADGGGWLTN
jgi:hypothetical protein